MENIVIQGYPGAFHHIAAECYFNGRIGEIVPADSFEALISGLFENDHITSGVMAVENTIVGSLLQNYKLLQLSGAWIIGEVYLRISQHLLGIPGTQVRDIREVHSHPIAIQQCRAYFHQHPQMMLVESVDTALSAREIGQAGSKSTAAIGSALAAKLYALDIIDFEIETEKKNYTRFFIIDKQKRAPDQAANKVSMSFTLSHEPGALGKVLSAISIFNANLTKIQSMPILGKPWEYQFFIDFQVPHLQILDPLILGLENLTAEHHILGIYQSGNHYESPAIDKT